MKRLFLLCLAAALAAVACAKRQQTPKPLYMWFDCEANYARLSHVDRVQENLETKMEQLKRNMDELTQYYRTVKLDHENNALFLQMIQEIKKEVNELKMKIA